MPSNVSHSTMSEGNNVWTCEEIASNASNWTLASDISLLRHLEHFSDQILETSQRTNDKLEDLLSRLDETALNLDLARNEFASLSNVQFIESRIYEEDETVNEEKIGDTENKVKENTKEDLKEAALRGLAVIEKYFDKVDVPESDSEDESSPNFVLRAKDPYIHRPLPHIIGTQEWYKSATAGILDSSSDSEVEAVSEKYSDDSDVGDEPERNDKANAMESEASDDGELLANKLEKPVANSTFNDTNRNGDLFDGTSQYNSATVQAPISQTLFAEQLAQKLGNVINANEAEPNINTRPIQKQQQSNYGRLFSNEPPPVDNDDDIFDGKASHGLFSGGDGLFDDLDDDVSFWGEKSTSLKPKDVQKENVQTENNTIKTDKNQIGKEPSRNVRPQKTIENLFDTNSSSDDEFFSGKSSVNDPKLSEENVPPKSEEKKTKKLSLFDDTDQSEDDDMFAKKPSKVEKKTSQLFDDDDDLDNSEDLFKPVSKASIVFDPQNTFNNIKGLNDNVDVVAKETIKKVPNLFSDSSSDSDDLFSPNNSSSKPKIISINKPKGIDDMPPKEIQEIDNKVEEKEKVSLFDDDQDDFFNKKENEGRDSPPEIPPNIFEDIPSMRDIFDDGGGTKSTNDSSPDRQSWRDEVAATVSEDRFPSTHRSSIFDNEPPSLSYNESSGIVRDPTGSSHRAEADLSSFYPYATSSRRLSAADTFGAYSEDSLLSSRVRRGSVGGVVEPETAPVTEEPASSFLEVTPSGKASELYSEVTGPPCAKPRKSVTFEDNVKVLEGGDVKVLEGGDVKSLGDDTETDRNVFGVSKEITEKPDLDEKNNVKEEGTKENVSAITKEELTDGDGDMKKESVEKTSPGKLKHNLNINVQALLPGGGSGARKVLSRPQRPVSVPEIPRYEDFLPTKSVQPEQEERGEKVEVLQSITKTRARIPNRRPSTRRGREAFRKSCAEFPTEPEEPAITPDVLVNRLDISDVTKKSFVKSDNFASPEFNKPDLFDNDNDDDLFSEKKLPPKSKILKKNLFDDDDDEIDFFQSISQPNKTFKSNVSGDFPTASKSITKTPPTTIRKLENVKVTENDPLSAFGR